jgi:hypothetical protein
MAPLARPIAAIAAASALAFPAAASATATPAVTAQAQAADAAFLAYAPPPSGPPGALCIVDTGVSSNPDTASGLIGSYALDNGPTSDADPAGHGTIEAMIAGAVGNGMIGAWPQLKIVSVRATNDPGAGQEPTYYFNDYYNGMNDCNGAPSADHVKAVLLALSSTIPPSADQAVNFATAVANLAQKGIAVIAAAGNDNGGAVEQPAAQPGVLAVGAGTAQPGTLSNTPVGTPCSFSAMQGPSVYAPGCGLNQAQPFTDQPLCCGDGTSQASAFAAAVVVALMSYDPTLTYTQAENLLVQTAKNGNLDVAAAFIADGLQAIVAAGNASVPRTPIGTTGAAGSAGSGPGVGATGSPGDNKGVGSRQRETPVVRIQSIRWRRGVLTITLSGVLPQKGRTHITLTYPGHKHARHLAIAGMTITIATNRPKRVLVRVYAGGKPISVLAKRRF